MKKTGLNSKTLKEELWQTLLEVRAKKITPQVANAVAGQSREILRVIKTEIEIAKMAGKRKPTAQNKFLA